MSQFTFSPNKAGMKLRSQRGSPVFKTPMSYSPRVAGEHVRPSPSKFDIWKEQLGLDDTVLEAQMSSDEEDENKENQQRTCTIIEYQALEKELDERNSQRDELLLKLKTLSDNNKTYKTRLEKEESNKKQQLKILRKTHEVSLREKENLVRNLESICEEQEARIQELETKFKGQNNDEPVPIPHNLHRLVTQIEELQTRVAQLTEAELTLQSRVDVSTHELQEIQDLLRQTEVENSQLQEQCVKLSTSKASGTTDDQKLVHKLEVENERLRADINTLQQEKSDLKSYQADSHQIEAEKITAKKLKEECERQRARIVELEQAVCKPPVQSDESKDLIKRLTNENHQLSQDVRSLNAKLLALQARSPEIVTKVKTVEVESEDLKTDYGRLQLKLSQVQQENANLQADIDRLRREVEQQGVLLHASKAQVIAITNEKTTQRQLYENEISRVTQSCETTNQQYERAQNLISQLQNENQVLTGKVEDEMSKNVQANTVVIELKEKVCEYVSELEQLQEDTTQELARLTFSHQTQIMDLQTEHDNQSLETQQKLNYTTAALSVVRGEITAISTEYHTLKREVKDMPTFMQNQFADVTKQICTSILDISKHNQELVAKYRKELKLRKKYHNQLVELKGNIRVFARVRPKIREDGSGLQAQNVVGYDQEDDGIMNVLNKGRIQTFELDRIFTAESTQQQVFCEVESLVTSCIDGYNVCIFAFGQTGSGKTHTMEGPTSNPGINQRALQQLFTETESRSAEAEYTITVSVLEIYNEQIRDLLNSETAYKLEVKMSSEGGLHVPGLTHVQVASAADVNQVFTTGHKNRATACTNMNEHSSRSHALLCIQVVGTNLTTGNKTLGKLNLVDLAGSERVSKSGADGTRLKEAQSINKSLSCLGDVMHALRSKQSHIPYRNSKLTYLLQDSLGGDSKTLMIVQVAPVEKNVGETLASLSFAQRVRAIELGQATKKLESAEVTELKEKLSQYEDLAQFSGGKGGSNKPTPSKIARRK